MSADGETRAGAGEGAASVRAWLPANALADRLPRATIESVVARWSADWFSTGAARLGAWGRGRAAGDALILSTGPAGPGGIAGAMIGEAPEPPTAADRAKLDEAGTACVDDLRRRLSELFGPAPASDRLEERHVCRIDLPGAPGAAGAADAPALSLSLSDALLAGWVRATLPPPPPRPPVRPLSQALEFQTIRLSAFVGRCRLRLRDLENWAVGDVLVLDRPLDAALDLVVGGRLCADAPCRLVDAGDELHLVLS